MRTIRDVISKKITNGVAFLNRLPYGEHQYLVKQGKMKKFIVYFIVPLTILASCNDNSPKNSLVLNDTVSINMGEKLESDIGGLSITFDSVPDDGRCPLNALCIWEGNAIVKFNITNGADVHKIYLNTANCFNNDTVLGGVAIELIDLMPIRQDFSTIEQQLYIAQIKVSQLID